MDLIKYNTTGAQPYNEAIIIKPVTNCNGFLATNTGDEIAFINDHVLYPGTVGTNIGDSKTFGGNLGEIYAGTIRIRFGATGGVNPEVTIDQKQYIIEQSNHNICR